MPTTRETTRPISEEEALGILRGWAGSGSPVGVLYSHSDGGLLAALRGRLEVGDGRLQIEGDGSVLCVWIAGADHRFGPLSLLRPDATLEATEDGLHLYTARGDWLFLSPSFLPPRDPSRLAPGA